MRAPLGSGLVGDVTLQDIGASSEAPRLWRCHPSGENDLSPIS